MESGNKLSARRISLITFAASILMGIITPAILMMGMAQGGGGHGTWELWYIGLVLWFVSWLVMLVSCIIGMIAWLRTGKPAWWIIPGFIVVIGVGVLGLWGMQG